MKGPSPAASSIPLSLYVHLPWCEKKCPYCDFNSHQRRSIPEDAYISVLLRDLDAELEAGARARELVSVFIGGGTPSLFSVAAIARLLEGIRARAPLKPDAEITLEANPGSVERQRLAGYARAGVTRFSLGIQSFDDAGLRRLGRLHDRRAARAAIAAAGAAGASSYNLDLMHGLPGQTLAQGLSDVEQAVAARAPHLSWYQFTIEPNTRFYRQRPRLPEDTVLAAVEERGSRRLRDAGYQRYEISAWAKPGERCVHNLNYWRFGDYLAIGAGAHGKLSSAEGDIVRYAKTRAPYDYLAPRGATRRQRRTLGTRDRIAEFTMNALRLADGFDSALFEARTDLPLDVLAEPLAELVDRGLLAREGSAVRATELGWRFLDEVLGHFFHKEFS